MVSPTHRQEGRMPEGPLISDMDAWHLEMGRREWERAWECVCRSPSIGPRRRRLRLRSRSPSAPPHLRQFLGSETRARSPKGAENQRGFSAVAYRSVERWFFFKEQRVSALVWRQASKNTLVIFLFLFFQFTAYCTVALFLQFFFPKKKQIIEKRGEYYRANPLQMIIVCTLLNRANIGKLNYELFMSLEKKQEITFSKSGENDEINVYCRVLHWQSFLVLLRRNLDCQWAAKLKLDFWVHQACPSTKSLGGRLDQ